ncbi:hypothetical protein FOZ63_025065, partial [Perkinsus olseni]
RCRDIFESPEFPPGTPVLPHAADNVVIAPPVEDYIQSTLQMRVFYLVECCRHFMTVYTDMCEICNIPTTLHTDTDSWITCDVCDKWYHQKCARVSPDCTSFVCPICRGDQKADGPYRSPSSSIRQTYDESLRPPLSTLVLEERDVLGRTINQRQRIGIMLVEAAETEDVIPSDLKMGSFPTFQTVDLEEETWHIPEWLKLSEYSLAPKLWELGLSSSVGEPRLPREDAFYDLGKIILPTGLIPNMITVPLGISVLMSDEIDCDYEDYDAIVAVAGAEGVTSGDVVEDHAKDKEAEADGRNNLLLTSLARRLKRLRTTRTTPIRPKLAPSPNVHKPAEQSDQPRKTAK